MAQPCGIQASYWSGVVNEGACDTASLRSAASARARSAARTPANTSARDLRRFARAPGFTSTVRLVDASRISDLNWPTIAFAASSIAAWPSFLTRSIVSSRSVNSAKTQASVNNCCVGTPTAAAISGARHGRYELRPCSQRVQVWRLTLAFLAA